jgi:hypothetical protein
MRSRSIGFILHSFILTYRPFSLHSRAVACLVSWVDLVSRNYDNFAIRNVL